MSDKKTFTIYGNDITHQFDGQLLAVSSSLMDDGNDAITYHLYRCRGLYIVQTRVISNGSDIAPDIRAFKWISHAAAYLQRTDAGTALLGMPGVPKTPYAQWLAAGQRAPRAKYPDMKKRDFLDGLAADGWSHRTVFYQLGTIAAPDGTTGKFGLAVVSSVRSGVQIDYAVDYATDAAGTLDIAAYGNWHVYGATVTGTRDLNDLLDRRATKPFRTVDPGGVVR